MLADKRGLQVHRFEILPLTRRSISQKEEIDYSVMVPARPFPVIVHGPGTMAGGIPVGRLNSSDAAVFKADLLRDDPSRLSAIR
jgi:hypothetical protein